MNPSPPPNIQAAADHYLAGIRNAKRGRTPETYQNAVAVFLRALEEDGLSPTRRSITDLSEDHIKLLFSALRQHAPATESLYVSAVRGFYRHVEAERWMTFNLSRLDSLIKEHRRKFDNSLGEIPEKDIQRLIEYARGLKDAPAEDTRHHLLDLRDRALILTLACSGLRIFEACTLTRGSIDMENRRSVIEGKRGKKAVIRYTPEAVEAMREYLVARMPEMDGKSGKPLRSLPLFARHDLRVKDRLHAIKTSTGREILEQRTIQALGPEAKGRITPHMLRHWFVTQVLRATGNMRVTQELARHESIMTTKRYAHLTNDELEKAYSKTFET